MGQDLDFVFEDIKINIPLTMIFQDSVKTRILDDMKMAIIFDASIKVCEQPIGIAVVSDDEYENIKAQIEEMGMVVE